MRRYILGIFVVLLQMNLFETKAQNNYGSITIGIGVEETVEISSSMKNILEKYSKIVYYSWECEDNNNILIISKDWKSCTIKGKGECKGVKLKYHVEYWITAGSDTRFEEHDAYFSVTVSKNGPNPFIPNVTANPKGGEVAQGTKVYLSSDKSNAMIYYTLDGTTPTENSKLFLSDWPIIIEQPCTLKAIAVVRSGISVYKSEVIEENYTIKHDSGSFFKTKTVEGTEVSYEITSMNPKTCKVQGKKDDNSMFPTALSYPYPSGTLTIPNVANGYTVSGIGDYAFMSTENSSIKLPSTLKTIGSFAFGGCSELASISIPSSVIKIDRYAFSTCGKITTFTLPASVTNFASSAIVACTSLKQIRVDNNNPIYDSRDNCNAIIHTSSNKLIAGCQSTIIPQSVTSIDSFAFRGHNIKTLELSDKIVYIGRSAFQNCNYLQSITIPKSISIIEDETFSGCKNLEKVILQEGIKRIGEKAFGGCKKLSAIYSYILNPFIIDENTFSYQNQDIFNRATLYVPKGTKTKYLATRGWNNFQNIVEMEGGRVDKGDVNGDKSVNGTDLVSLANMILGRNDKSAGADVNADGQVNGTDYVSLTNIILGRSSARKRAASNSANLSIEDFSIKAGETKEMLIDLNNPSAEITLVQFDLRLPDGLSIKKTGGEYDIDIAGRTTWRKHSLDVNATNGITRFLLSSSSNTVLSGTSGAIIKATLTASSSFKGGDIKLENILLVTPEEQEIKPSAYSYTVTVKESSKLQLSANPASGEVEKGTVVKLTATANGSSVSADIYYTLNGTNPTKSSTKYTSSGITINSACTLMAIAYKDGYETSAVITESYKVKEVQTNPDIQFVSVTCDNTNLSSLKKSDKLHLHATLKNTGGTATIKTIPALLNSSKKIAYWGTQQVKEYSSGAQVKTDYELPLTDVTPGEYYVTVLFYDDWSNDSWMRNDNYCIRVTVTDVIEPTSITVSPSSKTIQVGETFTPTYTLTPSNATTTVTWTSDDSRVASVDRNTGKVTGVKAGTTYINATTANGKTNYVKVTVNSMPKLQLSASPASGEVEKGTVVKLTAKANGSTVSADIYYTLNGATPSKSSTKYTSSGITINSDCTLKAIAYKDGYETSAVMTVNYKVKEPQTTPNIDLVSVTCYNTNLSSLTQKDKLKFKATFKNSGATGKVKTAVKICNSNMSVLYSGEVDEREFKANETTTVDYTFDLKDIPVGSYKATVMYYSLDNEDGNYYWWYYDEYVKDIKVVAAKPQLSLSASPASGEVEKGTVVKLTAKADGSTVSADIYYTLNGATPSKSSTPYTSAGITINSDCTIKAIAYKDGYETSSVLTANYKVIEVQTTPKIEFVSVTCDNTNLFSLTKNDKLTFHATLKNTGKTSSIETVAALMNSEKTQIVYWGTKYATSFSNGSQVKLDYEIPLTDVEPGQYYATVLYYDYWDVKSWIYWNTYCKSITVKKEPDVTIENGKTYYVKNVATGLYVSCGSSWGTHITIDKYGLDIKLEKAEDDIHWNILSGYNGRKGIGKGSFGTDGYVDNDVDENVNLTISRLSNGNYTIMADNGLLLSTNDYDNTVDFNGKSSNNPKAQWQFVPYDDVWNERLRKLEMATMSNPVDATFLIKCPNMPHYQNNRFNSSWTIEKSSTCNWSMGISVIDTEPIFEFFRPSANQCSDKFSLSQRINLNLSGHYKLEVQGFYRDGGYAIAAQRRTNGIEKICSYLYAGNNKVPLKSIFDDASTYSRKGFTTKSVHGYIPDTMTEAGYVFQTGAYNNELSFVTTESGKTIEIGVKGDVSYTFDNWTTIDNFRLTYYGTGTNSIGVIVDDEKEVSVYSLSGQRLDAPHKGINIINGKKVVIK